MRSHIRLRRLLAAGLLTAAVSGGIFTSAAHAGSQQADAVSDINVPEGNEMFLAAHATGVQIYSCNATPTGFAWGLFAPRANLYDGKGKLVATHFRGPTWQYKDGSTVVGQRVNGITVDPTAIQWLLLSAASWTTGAEGDRFANTSYIQRLSTVGGLPPAAETCNESSIGTTQEVGYSADYTFWKRDNA
jgi:uncharacterized protein DUF3455